MDANRAARLLCSLWPKIDAALSEENRSDRLRFISDLLQCFADNGLDVSQVLNLDEDICSCAQHRGRKPKKTRRRTGTFVHVPADYDVPTDYELVGGPFDGSTISLCDGLFEMPPGQVTFEPEVQQTRMHGDAIYKLRQVTDSDSDGNPTGEHLVYEHAP